MSESEFSQDELSLLGIGFTKCEVRRIRIGMKELQELIVMGNKKVTSYDRKRASETINCFRGYAERWEKIRKHVDHSCQFYSVMSAICMEADELLSEK